MNYTKSYRPIYLKQNPVKIIFKKITVKQIQWLNGVVELCKHHGHQTVNAGEVRRKFSLT